ncbi:TetR/AcrR family transcriptional regulator [Nocardioides dongxiaopingii]|uniref:TetR/AcrR family transcriptional regulator n=1 Tax=Nocardioides dongxiaopingii TaxID=2576036 RepID=UPI0010C767D3|nr:TetR/AcrR family transcriptional regulator [Nocardioides dongxiaopingii]
MPAAPRTARATARAELTRAILDSAATQLADVGPAALSVRAVARDLEMASSAVYRYFPSRDALLTALIIEAYDDLGAAVESAERAVRRGDLRGRWRAVAHGVRDWAVGHPHRYALTHGSPVPGYAAPVDTVVPATRVTLALLTVLRDAQAAGRTPAAGPARVPAAEKAALGPVMAFVDPPLSPAFAVRGLTAWATLFGHVSLELFGHLHRGVLDYDTHFATVVDQLAADLGLT